MKIFYYYVSIINNNKMTYFSEFKNLLHSCQITSDSNWNKSHYHAYIGMKLLVHIECMTYAISELDLIDEYTKLLHLIVQYPNVLKEFQSIKPLIVAGNNYIEEKQSKEEAMILIEGLRELGLLDY